MIWSLLAAIRLILLAVSFGEGNLRSLCFRPDRHVGASGQPVDGVRQRREVPAGVFLVKLGDCPQGIGDGGVGNGFIRDFLTVLRLPPEIMELPWLVEQVA